MARELMAFDEALELLEERGLDVVEHRVAGSAGAAVGAAEDIGYPVVLSVLSPQVVHKSDAGGVAMDLEDANSVRQAYEDIASSLEKWDPDAEMRGVVVGRKVEGGLELLLGGRTDPSFGKVLTFGAGGVMVELLEDVAIRVLPVDRDVLDGMVDQVRVGALLEGYRGSPPLDREALLDAMEAMVRVFLEDPSMVEFDLNPLFLLEEGTSVVDARLYMDDGSGKDARRGDEAREPLPPQVLSPSSVAVVGASSEPSSVGYNIFRNTLGMEGDSRPVNPNVDRVLRRTTYPDLASLPEAPDAAVIAVPAPVVMEVMEAMEGGGTPFTAVVSAGFSETGDEGEERERRLVELARDAGTRILGPNCLGFMLPHVGLNATFNPVSPLPGNMALVSQSGAAVTAAVDWAKAEGEGFSAVFSVGNQADIRTEDLVDLLADDERTSVIVCYIEELKDGRAFVEAASRAEERGSPVVALKAGASERTSQAISSHTGALAGSHEVYMAAFEQWGVVPATSMRDAMVVGRLLASKGRPRARRTVVVSNGGGFTVLSSDLAHAAGLEMVRLPDGTLSRLDADLPEGWSGRNPIDVVGDADAERFARVFEALLDGQDAWDVAVVIAVPTAPLYPVHLAQEVANFSTEAEGLVVACTLGSDMMAGGRSVLAEGGVPAFNGLREAFDSLGKIVEDD